MTRRLLTTFLRRATVLVATALVLVACAAAGPPPVTYVLGTPAAVGEAVEPLAGRPVIEVRPVLVPDYLDVTDILVRGGENVVAASPTGRWGERLSVGVTRALAAGLARRLPDRIVVMTAPADRPASQVLAEVEAFEARPDGMVVLVARWRVTGDADRDARFGERVSLAVASQGTGDAALVAAMTRAVEELAERVAEGLQRSGPEVRARR